MNAKTISLGCLGLLCVGLLVVMFPIGLRQYRSQAQLQAIAANGDPVSLSALGDPTPVSVWPMADKVDARREILQVIEPAEELAKVLHPYLNSDAATDLHEPLSAPHVALMEEGFRQHPEVLPALRDASHCQRYAWPSPLTPSGAMLPQQYMQVLLKEVSQLRMVGRLMLCGSRFLATKGKVDESAMLCVDLIRLTGLQETGPTVVVYQTNVAIRQAAVDQLNAIMQTQPLDPGTHAAIEKVLVEHESSDVFLHTLKTERAYGIASIQSMPAVLRVFSNQIPDYLAAMQNQIDRGKTPPCDWSANRGPPTEVMTQAAMTAVDSGRASFERDRIRCRCLRILNAIRAQDLAATEVDLDQLGLPAEATRDPYSGRPLQIEPVEIELGRAELGQTGPGWIASGEGWRIHSVGPNPFQNTANQANGEDLGLAP
ncbi:hypothetical protein [Rhodopirellula sp. P2]|uniref:hypothetical protein n=1 Tax=Rhodopirellula sp. P2 TaxID=2127060 RepID=UPI002368C552|nr:hypothetical protein [Rhodopirellula sp. P2]WDQ17594.1 hypothetical protein PSR62_03345 [Rhodopirellula sp. P2]